LKQSCTCKGREGAVGVKGWTFSLNAACCQP
jgi:hypothetical protein